MGTMDWLRRNWPDLLIGVALVAVIAGIIATLISGGTFFPVGGGSRTAENPTQSGPSVAGSGPAANQASGDQAQGAGVVQGAPAGADNPPVVAQDPSGAPAVTLGDPPASQAQDPVTPADQSQGQAGGIAVLPPDGQPSSSSLTTTAPPASLAATPQPSTPQSSITPAASVTASSSPEAPYRVSVGAYGNTDNAQRQLETFRAAGYPVFLGSQGALTIVLVGPYDTEAEARGVAQRISQSDLGVSDPTVYLLEPDDASTQADASTAPAATPPAAQAVVATTPAASPPAANPPAASQPSAVQRGAAGGDRYLQAGAYGSRDSSLPQRERLEGLGFVVSERIESDLIKLLVGPFDDAGLANAQSRLQAAGIESFPR